jgi:xanthine dehydrogenase YagS FAD-binding subunit
MRPFLYESFSSVQEAMAQSGTGSSFIAGGTTLLDLMKLEVLNPSRLLDLNRLPQMRGIEMNEDGLHIGALEKMSDVAAHPEVVANYPVISEALFKSASAQIRNMASIGGNLLQRTRCGYFRDVTTPCNKREPGTGCSAIDGENRMHAILGTSSSCIATHPSDLAVALVALDASVRLQNAGEERLVKLDDFYLLPGTTPDRENQLRPGELITEVRVPRLPWARKSGYLKIRDRESYEFALTSAAVALDLDGDTIRDVRIAVGGVGTKPWNLPNVRQALVGKPFKQETLSAAAKLAVHGATSYKLNGFKVDLVQRTIVRALSNLGDLA